MAEGCRRKAARARSDEDKTDWLGLADSWLQLLNDAEHVSEPSFPIESDMATRH